MPLLRKRQVPPPVVIPPPVDTLEPFFHITSRAVAAPPTPTITPLSATTTTIFSPLPQAVPTSFRLVGFPNTPPTPTATPPITPLTVPIYKQPTPFKDAAAEAASPSTPSPVGKLQAPWFDASDDLAHFSGVLRGNGGYSAAFALGIATLLVAVGSLLAAWVSKRNTTPVSWKVLDQRKMSMQLGTDGGGPSGREHRLSVHNKRMSRISIGPYSANSAGGGGESLAYRPFPSRSHTVGYGGASSRARSKSEPNVPLNGGVEMSVLQTPPPSPSPRSPMRSPHRHHQQNSYFPDQSQYYPSSHSRQQSSSSTTDPAAAYKNRRVSFVGKTTHPFNSPAPPMPPVPPRRKASLNGSNPITNNNTYTPRSTSTDTDRHPGSLSALSTHTAPASSPDEHPPTDTIGPLTYSTQDSSNTGKKNRFSLLSKKRMSWFTFAGVSSTNLLSGDDVEGQQHPLPHHQHDQHRHHHHLTNRDHPHQQQQQQPPLHIHPIRRPGTFVVAAADQTAQSDTDEYYYFDDYYHPGDQPTTTQESYNPADDGNGSGSGRDRRARAHSAALSTTSGKNVRNSWWYDEAVWNDVEVVDE
ncbi:uncharacterized protein EV422DRAFT_547712 [Fimicolochytrium jonesii]|uniref:uncharacterized protein n=1 Tax=Fimicolochytrium jonesii TaxID=1396493 RepID=UPI0022FEBD82|nr:uncharacterized protein EV422DRAFT_547712 [Fimicolochytrium jonesii]KAI8815952.1 hypothetical protein EV422DRAFT_547712 [Fimicolochytrium jonesii]